MLLSCLTRVFCHYSFVYTMLERGVGVVCVSRDQSKEVTAESTENNAVCHFAAQKSWKWTSLGWWGVRIWCRGQESHSEEGMKGRLEVFWQSKTEPHILHGPWILLKYSTCSDICVAAVLTPRLIHQATMKTLKSNQILEGNDTDDVEKCQRLLSPFVFTYLCHIEYIKLLRSPWLISVQSCTKLCNSLIKTGLLCFSKHLVSSPAFNYVTSWHHYVTMSYIYIVFIYIHGRS